MIYGWGINDANYTVMPTEKGKRCRCPYYVVWSSMVERCHSPIFQRKRPTYKGCKIADEWQFFMTFRAWMETQDWEGKQLDKDLQGGKLYSPDTCFFVEQWLNNFFTDHGRARGKWPIGVSWHKQKQKFQAYITINGKYKHLGYFDDLQEAYQAFRTAKLKHAKKLMKNYPDQRIKRAVLKKANLLYGTL